MYLKNSLIGFLKVKNVILLIAGIFLTALSIALLTQLFVYCHGDWGEVLYAENTPAALIDFIIGVPMIVCSRLSRLLINDAVFYSGCFEGDLNGYVDFAELADVTGGTPDEIQSSLRLLRPLYMKNFRVIKTVNYRYPEVIELYSKTVTCVCSNCGGWMEKRMYFTGQCPYCGGSDLTARVVAGQQFYYINDNTARKPNHPSYYEAPFLEAKRIRYAIAFGIALFFFLITLIVFMTSVSNFNNEPYFRDMLGRSITSYELFQSDLMNVIIVTAFALAGSLIAFPFLVARMLNIESAQSIARDFAKCPKPFLSLREYHQSVVANSPIQPCSLTPAILYRRIVGAAKEGYLRGCTPEKRGGVLRLALARQIVKDRCPCCGAPIIGAVSENYSCRYCGNLILGVIRKQ